VLDLSSVSLFNYFIKEDDEEPLNLTHSLTWRRRLVEISNLG